MRIESSVTSLSWIPSEAIAGLAKMPFEAGILHYDQPPPDVIEDLEALRVADRFRFANELRAYIEVEDDGEPLAELGPGAVLGERAVLEGGVRTATLRASTKCKVAAVSGEQLDRSVLAELSTGHRREDSRP